MIIDRRLLLKAGTLGLGALAVPGAAQLLAARGFTHNVASGEPRQRSVMLWTRYVPASGDEARLDYQLSPTPDFARIVAGGSVRAEAGADCCVKPVADGLEPGRWYHYRFVDAQGRFSPVGRTRTLPEGPVDRVPARHLLLRQPRLRLVQRLRPCRRPPRPRSARPSRRLFLRISARDLSGRGPGAGRAPGRARRRKRRARRLSAALRRLSRRSGPAAPAPALPDDHDVGRS